MNGFRDSVIVFLRRNWILLCILAGGLLLRLLVTLPGLCSGDAEAVFSRPDTPGYLGPAQALVTDSAYLGRPGGEPDAGRAPGFPYFCSIFLRLFGVDHIPALILALLTAGTLFPLAVYWAAQIWCGRKCALAAAAFAAFNLTAIANSPMLLTDTLFGCAAALVMGCFGLFCRRNGDWRFFVLASFLAGIGALIRPINSVWILPALFLVAILPGCPWRKKLYAGAAGMLIFLAVLFPWMARNASLGAGFCIDTNTGAMYHQNGAMLLAAVNRSNFEEEKAGILAELELEFADKEKYPDIRSQTDYRMKRFRELIFRHPFRWISQHFRPWILLPDAPTFLELLGVTEPDRGTMGILQREGLPAAVNHYFNGRFWILLPLLPLLLFTLLLYCLALWQLFDWLTGWRRHYYWLFLFLAFVEYFFFLPGPIVAPRYQIPALPFLALMAGMKWLNLSEKHGFFKKNANNQSEAVDILEKKR